MIMISKRNYIAKPKELIRKGERKREEASKTRQPTTQYKRHSLRITEKNKIKTEKIPQVKAARKIVHTGIH